MRTPKAALAVLRGLSYRRSAAAAHRRHVFFLSAFLLIYLSIARRQHLHLLVGKPTEAWKSWMKAMMVWGPFSISRSGEGDLSKTGPPIPPSPPKCAKCVSGGGEAYKGVGWNSSLSYRRSIQHVPPLSSNFIPLMLASLSSPTWISPSLGAEIGIP